MSTDAVKNDGRVVSTDVVVQLYTYVIAQPTKYWCNCVRVFRVDSFSHILPIPLESSKFMKYSFCLYYISIVFKSYLSLLLNLLLELYTAEMIMELDTAEMIIK